MPITKEQKQQLIADFRREDADTGSPEVQVAVLSK
ncbi:MAG: 30S ribosomal protein S15, partial [Actinomycetota bacterium]